MKPLIKKTADLILPGDELDVIAYGCTSASIVLGDETVADLLNAAKPTAKTTNPAFAAGAAFKALGVKRIAILTPYEKSVNELVQKSIEAKGFTVPVFGSFNENHDPTVAAINKSSLLNAIKKLLSVADFDAVFVSCTSVKLAESIVEIEGDISKREKLEDIVLVKVPNEIYPALREIFIFLFEQSGFKEIKIDKNVDFKKLYKAKSLQ